MSLLCELLAIVVKFMLRSPILVSESTSENLTVAQGETPKFRAFLRSRGLYGLLYEILTRYGPERSGENERIARAILVKSCTRYPKNAGGARNDPPEIKAGVWRR